MNLLTQIPFVEVLAKGGPVMVPIVAASIIALTVILERLIWGLRKERVVPSELNAEIIDLAHANKLDQIAQTARNKPSPFSRIIICTCNNAHRSRQELLDIVAIAGKKEAERLQTYLPTLSTIAAVGPLLGLLGTVFGIMHTFNVIGTMGVGNAQSLAAGIGEALVATASGLIVAIPSSIAHRLLLGKARLLTTELECASFHFADLILQQAEDPAVSVLEVQRQKAR